MVPSHHHPTNDERGDTRPTENDGFFAPLAEAATPFNLAFDINGRRSTAGLAGTVQIAAQFVIDGGLLVGFLPRSVWMVQVNHVSSPLSFAQLPPGRTVARVDGYYLFVVSGTQQELGLMKQLVDHVVATNHLKVGKLFLAIFHNKNRRGVAVFHA